MRLDASPSAPKDVAAASGVVALADSQGITVLKDGKTIKSAVAKDGYSAVALKGDLVAYGGAVSHLHDRAKESKLKAYNRYDRTRRYISNRFQAAITMPSLTTIVEK